MMTVREKYLPRLNIPEISDGFPIEFKTKSGLVLATGYTRMVIGERGPYLEFTTEQMCRNHIDIPSEEKHRIGNNIYYYDEYRSLGPERVKIYFQKKTVKYADYKIGYWYISPFDLTTDEVPVLIKPLEKKNV